MGVRAFGRVGVFRWKAFGVPKAGHRAEEYEDAFAFSEESPASGNAPAGNAPVRVAVADGATEAAFSRRWARLLAGHFVEHGDAALSGALPAARQQWAASVEAERPALPWYAAEKAEAGAFAAVLGLTLRVAPERDEGTGKGTWQAASVGDCNLFHVRGGRLLRAWPREDAGAFGHRPALVPSRARDEEPEARRARGSFQHGDAFVLATDATAAWLLRCGGDDGFAEALRWEDETAFAEAAERARAEGTLKNDDTTVVAVEVA